MLVKEEEILSGGCAHSSSFRLASLESIHAEIHALGRGRYENLNGATAYIATMARKSGNFVFSAPCLTCAIALRTAGIETVIYTSGNEDHWIENNLEILLQDEKTLKVYKRRVN